MKKLLCYVLVITIVFSMSTSAFAQSTVADTERNVETLLVGNEYYRFLTEENNKERKITIYNDVNDVEGIVIFDKMNDKLYTNGEEVQVTISRELESLETRTSNFSISEWRQFGETQKYAYDIKK